VATPIYFGLPLLLLLVSQLNRKTDRDASQLAAVSAMSAICSLLADREEWGLHELLFQQSLRIGGLWLAALGSSRFAPLGLDRQHPARPAETAEEEELQLVGRGLETSTSDRETGRAADS